MSISTCGRNANVASMLWGTAAREPGKTAIVERSRRATYAELRARAASVARVLDEHGVGPGDRVVVLLDRGVDAAACYFGVLATGGIAVPLNPSLRARQVEYAVTHADARVLVTSRNLLAGLGRDLEVDVATLDIGDVPPTGEYHPRPARGEDAAQITFTSGSTGLPKGVVATHENVWAAIGTVAGYLGLQADDRLAAMLPLSGVYGANQLLCSVLVGATVVFPASTLMNQAVSELREAEITVLAAVPPLWTQLLQATSFLAAPIPSLRIMQNAGGHIAPAVVRRLREVQPQARLFLQYGMTEVFRSTYLAPEEVDRHAGSIGRPVPGAEVLVVREDLTPCAPGEVGELVHAGPTVTLGYWRDPERTAAVYRPHPTRPAEGRVVFSGDLVRRDEAGLLYYVGRRDRMIKTLGFRVGPDEVLDVLHASGQITEGVVTAEPDAKRGNAIVAYVVLAAGGSLKELTAFARMELPRYMQPTRIEVRDQLPRNPNGKHDILALRLAGVDALESLPV